MPKRRSLESAGISDAQAEQNYIEGLKSNIKKKIYNLDQLNLYLLR